ncbi:MAG: NADH-quinone oxidoreductase subunit J [Gemmatimonadota bacterium]|jgi:NADH-quinone oxidoreductase subunit J
MMESFFFLFFAVMAAAGAIMMIASRNPVSSLMYLVLAFFALSGIFVLLDAHFLAAVQVIVYAGAIMVLFLFVIMLLNLGHREDIDMRGHVARLVALVAGSALFAAVAALVFRGDRTTLAGEESRLAVEAMVRSRGAVGALAEPLFTSYLVPFELTSLLLLVAIVGAIVLARRRAP